MAIHFPFDFLPLSALDFKGVEEMVLLIFDIPEL